MRKTSDNQLTNISLSPAGTEKHGESEGVHQEPLAAERQAAAARRPRVLRVRRRRLRGPVPDTGQAGPSGEMTL